MEIPGFVLRAEHPRTKKNSGRVITIPNKGARRCYACGHMPGFPKVLPSEAYERWEAACLRECFGIKAKLAQRSVVLPITAPISIEAHIYLTPAATGQLRKDCGDVAGFHQAIGDMLQEAGIIADDRQIEDWDGTRRHADTINQPRVEIYITVVGAAPPVQEKLPDLVPFSEQEKR